VRDFLERHGLHILLISVLSAVILCLLSYFSSTSDILHNAMGIVTSPFRNAAAIVTEWVEDKQRYYEDYSALVEENEALRQEIAQLREQSRQAETDREENALLRGGYSVQEGGVIGQQPNSASFERSRSLCSTGGLSR